LDALTGIRTPVLALKGPRPGPLDDEGAPGQVDMSAKADWDYSKGGAAGQILTRVFSRAADDGKEQKNLL
jgi:hypothetical protein